MTMSFLLLGRTSVFRMDSQSKYPVRAAVVTNDPHHGAATLLFYTSFGECCILVADG